MRTARLVPHLEMCDLAPIRISSSYIDILYISIYAKKQAVRLCLFRSNNSNQGPTEFILLSEGHGEIHLWSVREMA